MKKVVSLILALCIISNQYIYAEETYSASFNNEEIIESVIEENEEIINEDIDSNVLEENESIDDQNISTEIYENEESRIVDNKSSYGIIKSFKFESKYNSQYLSYDIEGYFVDEKIYCFLPTGININNLIATYESTTENIKVNGKLQESSNTINDFSNALVYVLDDNKETSYTVEVLQSDIPTIEIETEEKQNITDKENYINASMKITGTEEFSTGLYDGEIEIKGRGNFTWTQPKKPYKIKLNSKSEVLGMDADKHWVLLANYVDKSLMRNKLALDIASEFGLEYTPDSVFVDVIINGEYKGNYLLCEQIRVSKSRVNITELKESDVTEDKITGGYLLEIDQRRDADFWFDTTNGVPITYKSPEIPNEQQQEYIENYINEFEEAIYSKNFYNEEGKHYSEYIDVDTFIDWYLINELFKNNDANFFSSVNMYKDRDSKLCMGPVWDFDIAAGNINFNNNDDPTGWWVKTASWYTQLFRDKDFTSKVISRYSELRILLQDINSQIDSYSNDLNLSQNMNFIRWDILNTNIYPNACVPGSYSGEITYLKSWLNERVEWIDNNIESISQLGYKGNLTSIKDGQVVNGSINLEGWYLYDNEIESIEVLVDDTSVGYASRFYNNTLDEEYAEYDTSNAGYKFKLDTTIFENGKHTITIRCNSSDNTYDTLSIVINVENSIMYMSHIQDIGWQNWTYQGNISGTTGQSKQMEAIKIDLNGAIQNAKIKYKVHVEDYGWQDWVYDGKIAGTTGESKQLEAIQIELENTDKYSIAYRVHVEDYGWQDWVYDGKIAGTTGEHKRIEAIEIKVIDKIENTNIYYKSHIEDYGWQEDRKNGETSGTVGISKRLEALIINIENLPKGVNLKYKAHIEDYGWQSWVNEGQLSGTTGQSKKLEAIQIKLENTDKYSIAYRVHVEDYGWQDWVYDGNIAGTTGQNKRVEAIEIKLINKYNKEI